MHIGPRAQNRLRNQNSLTKAYVRVIRFLDDLAFVELPKINPIYRAILFTMLCVLRFSPYGRSILPSPNLFNFSASLIDFIRPALTVAIMTLSAAPIMDLCNITMSFAKDAKANIFKAIKVMSSNSEKVGGVTFLIYSLIPSLLIMTFTKIRTNHFTFLYSPSNNAIEHFAKFIASSLLLLTTIFTSGAVLSTLHVKISNYFNNKSTNGNQQYQAREGVGEVQLSQSANNATRDAAHPRSHNNIVISEEEKRKIFEKCFNEDKKSLQEVIYHSQAIKELINFTNNNQANQIIKKLSENLENQKNRENISKIIDEVCGESLNRNKKNILVDDLQHLEKIFLQTLAKLSLKSKIDYDNRPEIKARLIQESIREYLGEVKSPTFQDRLINEQEIENQRKSK